MSWTINGSPVDLSEYTAKGQVRESIGAEDVLLELTTENDRVVLDSDGSVVVLISDTDTAELAPLQYGVWDLFLIASDDSKLKFAKGAVQIFDSVTKFV